jgi:predicted nuclease of predicted toxin-antitoxin system
MKFLANENFPFPSIKALRNKGFHVKSISDESPGIPDRLVIEAAQAEDLVILTFDRDYGELIVRYGLQNPPSVIYFRMKGETPDAAANLLITLIEQGITFMGHFTVIESAHVRQRKY